MIKTITNSRGDYVGRLPAVVLLISSIVLSITAIFVNVFLSLFVVYTRGYSLDNTPHRGTTIDSILSTAYALLIWPGSILIGLLGFIAIGFAITCLFKRSKQLFRLTTIIILTIILIPVCTVLVSFSMTPGCARHLNGCTLPNIDGQYSQTK